MNDTLEAVVRQGLAAAAARVPATGPDWGAARRLSRRRARRRAGLSAAGALTVVAVVGATVLPAGHRGDGPAGGLRADASPFPGFVDLPPVSLPPDVEPRLVSASGDQVWVVGWRHDPTGETSTSVVLHGRAGEPLVAPPGAPAGLSVLVRGGRAFLITGVEHAGQVLQVRDAATGVLQREEPLTAEYGAESALLQATGGGTGPLVVVMGGSVQVGPTTDDRVRVGVLSPEGTVGRVTPFVSLPTFPGPDGPFSDGGRLVRVAGGVPRSLIMSNRARIDLATGAVRAVRLGGVPVALPGVPDPAAARSGYPVGEVHGRLVWSVTADGATSPDEAQVQVGDPDGVETLRDVGTRGFLTVVDGHLFRGATRASGAEVREQALDPDTLQPAGEPGPVVRGTLLCDGSTCATHTPASTTAKGARVGGSLTVLRPVGSR